MVGPTWKPTFAADHIIRKLKMGRQVFRYNQGGKMIAPFFTTWGGIAAVIGISGLVSPPGSFPLTINKHPATIEQAHQFFICAVAVGFSVVLVGVGISIYRRNFRIEIENGKIRWFNWLGKMLIEANLASAHFSPEPKFGYDPIRPIQTDGGDIPVRLEIDRFGVLWSILAGTDTYDVTATYRPAPATFKTWTQVIQFGPDGIQETDHKGKLRVKAGLDQIVESQTLTGDGSNCYLIHTTQGSIRTSISLPKSGQLFREVQQVLESRKPH